MDQTTLDNLKANLLKLESGFNIGSATPIDARFLMTKDDMLNALEATMPPVYFTLCTDDNNLYVYSSTNSIDSVTGKFRAITDIASLASALRYVGTIDNTADTDPTTVIENFYSEATPIVGDVINLKNAFIYNDATYPAGTNVVINSVTNTDGVINFTFDPLGGVFDESKISGIVNNAIINSGHITNVKIAEGETYGDYIDSDSNSITVTISDTNSASITDNEVTISGLKMLSTAKDAEVSDNAVIEKIFNLTPSVI